MDSNKLGHSIPARFASVLMAVAFVAVFVGLAMPVRAHAAAPQPARATAAATSTATDTDTTPTDVPPASGSTAPVDMSSYYQMLINQNADEFWYQVYYAVYYGYRGGFRLHVENVGYLPFYVIDMLQGKGITLILERGLDTFTLTPARLNSLNPSLNYAFTDLWNLGYGTARAEV